jgi:AcrR family transcriptional regulator
MPRGTGLRDTKRRQTRDALAEAALRLFAERGFDAVTVAEIAAEANVSSKTAFNYFPKKEDLLLGRRQEIELDLLLTVRQRPQGEAVIAAVRRHTLKVAVHLHEVPAGARRALRKLIESSPEVHARLRQVSLTTEQALAILLREDAHATPHDPTPLVVASALGVLARLAYGVPGWPAGGPKSLEQTVAGINAAFDRFEAGFSNFELKGQ